jgi:hypothetical protein
MNKYEKIIFLLGKTQASIEALAYEASRYKNPSFYDLICDFEESFNRQLKDVLASSNDEDHSKQEIDKGLKEMLWI